MNIQWHNGKSSPPPEALQDATVCDLCLFIHLYVHSLSWIPSNSGSPWKICACACVCENICIMYLLLIIDLHRNQARCPNVFFPCFCFSCGALWVSEVIGFIISAQQTKCEKATECHQTLQELTWLASPKTGGQAFEIWLQLSMKQINHKNVMSQSTILWDKRKYF